MVTSPLRLVSKYEWAESNIPAHKALCFGGLSWNGPDQLVMAFVRQVPVLATQEAGPPRAGN